MAVPAHLHGVPLFGRVGRTERPPPAVSFRAAVCIQLWLLRFRRKAAGALRRRAEAGVAANGAAAALRQLVERYFDTHMALFPFQAPLYGEYRYNAQFGNNLTPEYRAAKQRLAQSCLEALKAIPTAGLDGEARTTYSVFQFECENDLLQVAQPTQLLPLDHMMGLHETFAVLGSGQYAQPFASERDYRDWLAKCAQFPEWARTAVARLREGLAGGVTLPKVEVQLLVEQLGPYTATGADSVFYAPAENYPDDVAEPARAALTAELLACIDQHIAPAFRALKEFLEGEYAERAREAVGYGAMPNGLEWYRAAIHNHVTTLRWDVDTIYALGEEHVAAIEREIDAIRAERGFAGSARDFWEHLRADDSLYYQSEAELLAAFAALKERAAAAVRPLFDIDYPDFEIRPVEEFRATGAPAAEYQPGVDGSPGVLYVNTQNLRLVAKWQTETLFLHEGVPGHHLQASATHGKDHLPRFQRFASYSAFDEGYALYCESIGAELGFFTEHLQLLGRLHDDLLRAMRLVVDVGLHAKGWSREQAIEYMRAHSAMEDAEIESEVDRYIALPAQALSYKLGQLTFTRLRAEAERALGPKWDVRAFHRVCLCSGSVPLHVLTENVNQWVASLSPA